MSNTITVQLPEEVILDALKQLPPARRRHLLQQLAEEQQPTEKGKIEVVSFPADALERLTGIISVGGDALAESEQLYDDE